MNRTESLRLALSRIRPIRADNPRELAERCDHHWRRAILTVNGHPIPGRARRSEPATDPCIQFLAMLGITVHTADFIPDNEFDMLAFNDPQDAR